MKKYDPKYDAVGYTDDNYWAGAKKACDDIGMSLPDKSKLKSIYDAGKKDSSLGLSTSDWFWSSEGDGASYASSVNFSNGSSVYDSKSYSGDKVLCIGD